MTIAAPAMTRNKALLWMVCAGAAVALAGFVFATRDTGHFFQPLADMAETPVVMPEGRRIWVQRHEVTVSEWNKCHDAGGCTLELRPRPGLDPSVTPATGLSYLDVTEYLNWINEAANQNFRLPTASEWSHMAYSVLPEEPDPIFTDPALTWASSYLTEGLAPRAPKAPGSFSTSPEGIADLDGSVWEWTQDCYAEGITPDHCPAFLVAGEHMAAIPFQVRDPARGGCAVGAPPAHLGMRLVSDTAIEK